MVFNLFCKIAPLQKLYLEIAPLSVVFALSENIILFWKQFTANEVQMGNLVKTQLMQTYLQNKCCHFQNNSWFPLMRSLRLVFICKIFQSSLQVAQFKLHGVSPVLFMSRRLRYLLRICSKLLGRNLAQQNTSFETPVACFETPTSFLLTTIRLILCY